MSVGLSIKLVNALRPLLPFLTSNPVTRTILLPQFTAKPWAIPQAVVLPALLGFRDPGTSSAFAFLSKGPQQEGAAAGTLEKPVLMVWGKQDFVTPSRQSALAQQRFPDAEIRKLDRCGHFPHWDQPEQTAELILRHTADRPEA